MMGALDRDRLDRRSTTAHYAHCPIDVDGARHARVRQLTRRKRLRRLASERPVERWLLLASQRIEVEALIRDSTLNPTPCHWAVPGTPARHDQAAARPLRSLMRRFRRDVAASPGRWLSSPPRRAG